ncbi:hypothetical protein RND81_14G200600 [Saponaria officinalis]
MDAWSILSDPNKKWLFDNELAVYLQRIVEQQQQQQLQQPPQQQPPPPPQQQPPVRVEAVRVENPQLNTFQFFQPPQAPPSAPQTAAVSMWQQQQEVAQHNNNQNFLQQHSGSNNLNNININNNLNSNSGGSSNQVHQIEFMQPPPVPQPQPQLPQWQMRDPTPVKGGGERNKGVMNGIGMTSLMGTPAASMINSTTQPITTPMMRRVGDVAVPMNTGPTLTPTPAPHQAVPGGGAVVRETRRVIDGNVVINNVVVDNNSNISNVGVMHVNDNVVSNDNNNAAVVDDADVVVNEENDDGGEDDVETFWTSCPYCFYIFEYQKEYQECTLRCQNCRRGFQAVQIPNPPPLSSARGGGAAADGDGKKDKEKSFCCWGFFPLGFSTVAWRKQNRMRGPNVAGNWVPFSPMFACPVENGGRDFQWFQSNGGASVGPKNMGRPPFSYPRVQVIDEDGDFNSDPSDSDSSDHDWRRNPTVVKKKKIKKRGRVWKGGPGRRGKVTAQNVDTQNQANHNSDDVGEVPVGGEVLEDGSNPQDVVGLASGPKEDARKKVAATLTRNQVRRRMKNMGKLDLNVEFNNEGDEHAPAVSAVNVGGDGVENIEFFEGLDEFLSTLPILNAAGDEKAKPS